MDETQIKRWVRVQLDRANTVKVIGEQARVVASLENSVIDCLEEGWLLSTVDLFLPIHRQYMKVLDLFDRANEIAFWADGYRPYCLVKAEEIEKGKEGLNNGR